MAVDISDSACTDSLHKHWPVASEYIFHEQLTTEEIQRNSQECLQRYFSPFHALMEARLLAEAQRLILLSRLSSHMLILISATVP
jgi:hypothetical protein